MLKSKTIINEKTGIINYQFPAVPPMKGTYFNKDQMRIAVIRFVQELGIRPNLTGYHLLIDAILLSLESPDLLKSLTKRLYPEVAKNCCKDVRSIERNIRRAIESAYEYDPGRIQSLFYYKVEKPYVSEVISMAVEAIKFELIKNNCQG